jgi:hypothetical protein
VSAACSCQQHHVAWELCIKQRKKHTKTNLGWDNSFSTTQVSRWYTGMIQTSVQASTAAALIG